MKAWFIDSFDGIEKLRLGEAPEPAPRPDQVVLRVAIAGLNPADRYLAMAQYPAKPPLPHILGRDAVGAISAIGNEVKGLSIGQKMMVLRGATGVDEAGTFAEQVAVNASSLVNIPEGWTDEEAAGATLVYLTAYQALTQWGELPADAVVLMTGASGGVGVASIQLAKAMGFTPVALSRSAAKQNRLKDLGATVALDPGAPSLKKALRDALGARRVDLAIDNIGGPLFNQVIETLGENGRVSCVGRLAGEVPAFNTASLFFRRLRIGGVAVGTYSAEEGQAAWGKIVSLLASTQSRPIVDRVFAFEKLPDAFARLHEGPMGKVLLSVSK